MSHIDPWITDIASFASIIGLWITIWVLRETKKIKLSFLAKARLPEVVTDLIQISSKLAQTIPDWDTSKHEILIEISRCKSILKNIKPKLNTDLQEDISKLIVQLDEKRTIYTFWRKKYISEYKKDDVWKIYTEIQSIIESLNQMKSDLRWEE
jgi:hypothetical protein